MIISFIFLLFVTFGLGFPLILLIIPKSNRFIKLGLSFPLGIGIFTLLMFGSNLLGIKFTLINESFLLLTACLPLILIQRQKIKTRFVTILKFKNITKFQTSEKVMLGFIFFFVATGFINTLYWPVYMWDSVVLYDFRAHVFALTGFMKDALSNNYYYSYPLLTSLAHSIVYLSGGSYPEFIYSLFYLSLGLGFYGLLIEFIPRKPSLFFTMILLFVDPIFHHSLYSYTNLTYTTYLSLGAILIYLWDKKGSIGYLILSGLMIGLSTWVRAEEPFWVGLLLIVFIISVYRKKLLGLLIYLLSTISIHELWKYYQGTVAGGRVMVAGEADGYGKVFQLITDIANWTKIIEYLYLHVIAPWGSAFALFLLAGILTIKLKKFREQFLIFLLPTTLFAVLVAGIFVFSVYIDYWFRIGDATERLSMLFYPLFIFPVALILFKSFHNK